MKKTKIGIIGGGLAGLAAAIEMARKGQEVILWEKQSYPFHKVCGEYISMESWPYLEYLGMELNSLDLPRINKLKVSVPSGASLDQSLGLGGFGISRYQLDALLAEQAKKEGVKVFTSCRVREVSFEGKGHRIQTDQGEFEVELLVGAYGKRSQLDKKWEREFIKNPLSKSKNFTAVKYHLQADLQTDLIGLHLFEGGYCGISKVEGKNRYCFCYLTLAESIQEAGGIKGLEKGLMSQNPSLKEYLNYPSYYDKPEVISQVNFKRKSKVEDHAFLLGDTAGLIVPLCGNGMSMALHAAYIWSSLAEEYLNGNLSRSQLEANYHKAWRRQFAKRLFAGRFLQKLFYRLSWSEKAIWLLNRWPALSRFLVKQTHGNVFYP